MSLLKQQEEWHRRQHWVALRAAGAWCGPRAAEGMLWVQELQPQPSCPAPRAALHHARSLGSAPSSCSAPPGSGSGLGSDPRARLASLFIKRRGILQMKGAIITWIYDPKSSHKFFSASSSSAFVETSQCSTKTEPLPSLRSSEGGFWLPASVPCQGYSPPPAAPSCCGLGEMPPGTPWDEASSSRAWLPLAD